MREAISLRESGDINCDYISQIKNLIIRIQNFSEEKVRINHLVRSSYDNASFEGEYNLEVPERLVFFSSYGQEYGSSISANLAVVAHEYGHALIEKSLEKVFLLEFPKLAGFIMVRQEISLLQIATIKNLGNEELQEQLKNKN